MKKHYFLKSVSLLKYFTTIVFTSFITTALGQGEWLQKAAIGSDGRSQAVGLSINFKGYIGLGKISSNNYTADFWEYNPISDTWAQKATFPGNTRANAVSFTIGSLGYVGTGRDDSGLPSNEFYQYNPSTNIWTPKANLPYAADSAAGFAFGNMGYIGIGSESGGPVDDFYKYDPTTDSWSQIANFPSEALGTFGFAINSKGYISTVDSSDNFWEYDPLTDNWTQMNDFPGTQSNHAAFVLNGKGYAGTSSNDFWEFDPASGSWTQIADFDGVARKGAAGFSIGNKGYIGTGVAGSNYLDDFWEFARRDTFSADFIAANVCLGKPVVFMDNSTTTDSTTIATWNWNFGDGDSSAAQHPEHIYSLAGNYTVKIIITDDLQNKDSVEKVITIHQLPVTGFTYSFNDSVTVNFSNNTTGAGEYYWQFGDDSTSTGVNPMHTYAARGVYEVCLSGYNVNGCEGKICKNIDLSGVGIENAKNSNNTLKIYPNPATGQVFLSGQINLNEKINIRFIDVRGKVVLSKNIENSKSLTEPINISTLQGGFYLMEMQNGNEVTRMKLMVK